MSTGRGEGLAGLREQLEQLREKALHKAYAAWPADSFELGRSAAIGDTLKLIAALEAAAPAGTPTLRFEHDNDSLEDFVRCLAHATIYHGHDTGDVIGEYWREEAIEWVKEFGVAAAALATPSPQAPQQESSFSTTSAREQSSATASSHLSAADFAEIPATRAHLLGVATDLLERGKEAMECDPQREEVGSDCWIWCHQVSGWLDEVSKLPKTAAATQEPAGSEGSEQEDEPSDEMALELSRDNDEWTEVLTFPKRGFYRVRAVGAIPPLGTFCGAKGVGDYSCAECGFGLTEPCKHWKATLTPGSPRKVGERR